MRGIVLFIALSIADAYLSQAFVDVGGIDIETNRLLVWLFHQGLPVPLAKFVLTLPFVLLWTLLRCLSPRDAGVILMVANIMMLIIVLLELEVLLLIWY